MASKTVKTYCRFCHAYCPMEATVEDNRLIRIREAGLIRTDIGVDVALGLIRNEGVLVGREDQVSFTGAIIHGDRAYAPQI